MNVNCVGNKGYNVTSSLTWGLYIDAVIYPKATGTVRSCQYKEFYVGRAKDWEIDHFQFTTKAGGYEYDHWFSRVKMTFLSKRLEILLYRKICCPANCNWVKQVQIEIQMKMITTALLRQVWRS